jgi:acetyl esterase/lipase
MPDILVGPYPETRDRYRACSAINFVDHASCPAIILQGLEDRICPASQAESIVAALRAKGVPIDYVPLAGEQHGYRRVENIQRALDAELYFMVASSDSNLPTPSSRSSSRTDNARMQALVADESHLQGVARSRERIVAC